MFDDEVKNFMVSLEDTCSSIFRLTDIESMDLDYLKILADKHGIKIPENLITDYQVKDFLFLRMEGIMDKGVVNTKEFEAFLDLLETALNRGRDILRGKEFIEKEKPKLKIKYKKKL